jgi:hypothetical protein
LLSALCLLLALLSKESALTAFVPAVAAALYQKARSARFRRGHLMLYGVLTVAVYALYFHLRIQSGAMTPDHAPVFYRWKIEPFFLLNNLTSYLFRSLTFSCALLPLFWLITRKGPREKEWSAKRPALLAACAAGFLLSVAPALPVPARSNLYAYIPSMYMAVALGVIVRCSGRWSYLTSSSRRYGWCLLLLAGITLPVAWAQGYSAHLKHRHTLAWVETIKAQEGSICPPVITVTYSPDEMPPGRLGAEDFIFLEMALRLSGIPARVRVNPAAPDTAASLYRLQCVDGDLRLRPEDPLIPDMP